MIMTMKRYISIALGLLTATTMVSCSWFDISPKTDIKASEFFEKASGFESALTGLYVKMTDNNAYGKNYTMGYMERLVQRYDNISAENKLNIYIYNEQNSSRSTQAAMWLASYNIIANANNLLKWLDANGERVLDPESHKRIRGEAHAVRAFLHFDLLRLWGPMYRSDSTSRSIPYRLSIGTERLPRLAANEVMDNVVNDLKTAEELLSYQEDSKLSGVTNQYNRCHFTIHSVRALMARVLNYRDDKEGAMHYAQLAIDGCNLSLANDQTMFDDPALFCESLFCINYYDMSNLMGEWTDGTPEQAHSYITMENLWKLYPDRNDARYRHNLGFLQFNDVVPAKAITRKYVRNQNMIPLIRLAEMYYILCESATLDEAPKYLNYVLESRGLSNSGTFASDKDRILALDLEYSKEFYAEGQYFHFLKLHGLSADYYPDRTYQNWTCPLSTGLTKTEFIFPLPDDEIEYGWVDTDSDSDTDGDSDGDADSDSGSDE